MYLNNKRFYALRTFPYNASAWFSDFARPNDPCKFPWDISHGPRYYVILLSLSISASPRIPACVCAEILALFPDPPSRSSLSGFSLYRCHFLSRGSLSDSWSLSSQSSLLPLDSAHVQTGAVEVLRARLTTTLPDLARFFLL